METPDTQPTPAVPQADRLNRPTASIWTWLAVFALALAVRGIYLYDSSDNPAFNRPTGDSQIYDTTALTLVRQHRLPENLFWQSPLYPLFLAAVHSLSHASILAVKIIQIAAGALTCVLAGLLAQRLIDRTTGLVAALIATFYGPMIFYDAELLATGWAALLSLALILMFLKTAERDRPSSWFTLGLIGILSILVRPTFLPFFAVGVLWLVAQRARTPEGRRDLPTHLIYLAVGFALLALPFGSLKNQLTGHWGLLPNNGAINIYIGNNPDPCETVTLRPGMKYQQLVNWPAREGITDPADKQRFFRQRVIDFATGQPVAFAANMLDKTVQLLSAREVPNTINPYLLSRWSSTLQALLFKVGPFGFPFGVVFPLAVIGLIGYGRRWPWPLMMFLLLYAGAVVLVHVNDRYRLPLTPALCVLAAGGIMTIVRAVQQHRTRTAALSIVAIPVIAILISLPGPFCLETDVDYEADLYYSLAGNYGLRHRDLDEAIADCQKALELNDDYLDAHFRLGVLQGMADAPGQALLSLRRAAEIAPDEYVIHLQLARTWAQKGDLYEALQAAKRAVELAPNEAMTHHGLATLHARRRAYEPAVEHYEQAIALQPDWLPPSIALAKLLATSPTATREDHARALELARDVCARTRYQNPVALQALAAAHAALGNHSDAIQHADRARNLALLNGQPRLARALEQQLRRYRAKLRAQGS